MINIMFAEFSKKKVAPFDRIPVQNYTETSNVSFG